MGYYDDFWEYQYNPELDRAIPRELQENAYAEWQKEKSKDKMQALVNTFGKLISSEIMRYQGTLDRNLLHSFAKRYVTDAVRSYDPKSGNQLSTHIVNNLKRLHRLNYQNVQALKIPEEVQGKMNEYMSTKQTLLETLGRDPTDEEMSKTMNYNVKKLKKYLKFETGVQDLSRATQFTETSPEEDALDFLYYDLPDKYKKVLEFKTGYGGSPILSGKEIAKKLNLSPVRVTQMSDEIAKKMYKILYNPTEVNWYAENK